MSDETIERAAELSPCGRYRYSLTRAWRRDLPRVAFVMLNPSTADAAVDDPTIRKCVTFARDWGYGSLEVVNLHAWRATDPADLAAAWRRSDGVVGLDNDAHIHAACMRSTRIVAAWGTKSPDPRRAAAVLAILARFGAYALRVTKEGHPQHPLYLPGATGLQAYGAWAAESEAARG